MMIEELKKLAKDVFKIYLTNDEVAYRVNSSPEFYRALVWETKLVANVEDFDGTTEYWMLIEELEALNTYF